MCLQASDNLLAAAARLGMEEVWSTFVVSCSPSSHVRTWPEGGGGSAPAQQTPRVDRERRECMVTGGKHLRIWKQSWAQVKTLGSNTGSPEAGWDANLLHELDLPLLATQIFTYTRKTGKLRWLSWQHHSILMESSKSKTIAGKILFLFVQGWRMIFQLVCV